MTDEKAFRKIADEADKWQKLARKGRTEELRDTARKVELGLRRALAIIDGMLDKDDYWHKDDVPEIHGWKEERK